MFAHSYRYFFILFLAAGTFVCTEFCEVYTYFNISIHWLYAFLTILAITTLVWECNRLCEQYILHRFQKNYSRLQYLILFFCLGNIIVALVCGATVYVVGAVMHKLTWNEIVNPLKLNFIYGCLVNLFFHLLNAILVFFREYKNQWIQAEELRRITSQAQIQSLKSQINPHFLFNNLNVLSAMVIRDNPAANKFIEEFASVYRYVLNNQDKELVPLSTELEFIQSYLFLLKQRFTEGLNVGLSIPERYTSWHIVPAALQMLIENAIKHNIVSTFRPLNISIYANGEGTITVTNNLQRRRSVERSYNIGLKNIDERYKLISGRDIIVKTDDEQFEVTLPLLELN